MNAVSRSQQRWLIFFGLVFCIKSALFCLDSSPMFFLGDSASYIHTALSGWVPPDRSFLYGFVIRLVAVSTHSLRMLVAFQVLLSFFTTLLFSYVLIRFFRIGKTLAFAFGICSAIEPLQLLYERYVLTETISLFVLALYFLLLFLYLEKPSLWLLGTLQLAGTVLIGFRLSFLPVVVFNSIATPVMCTMDFFSSYKHRDSQTQFLDSKRSRAFLASAMNAMLHLAISLSAFYVFHSAYKHLNGHLTHLPQAYQYQSGYFLLADWSPIVKAEDFPDPESAEAVFANLSIDLRDRHMRGGHRWMDGGLIAALLKAYPNPNEADRVARLIAINALKRDPLGVALLAGKGFLDYWDVETLQACMAFDRGPIEIPTSTRDTVQMGFGLDVEDNHIRKTVTNTYYFAVWPWYLILLCSPLFAFLCWLVCSSRQRRYAFVVFASICAQMVIVCSLIERPTIRYLHAVSWLFMLTLPPIASFFIKRSCIRPE